MTLCDFQWQWIKRARSVSNLFNLNDNTDLKMMSSDEKMSGKDDKVVNALRDFLDNQILQFPQMTFGSDRTMCYKQTSCVYAFTM